MVHTLIESTTLHGFAADVRAGLTKSGQKELPSKYFYDDVGSALFEVICLLDEYGLTRADARLLSEHADDVVRPLGARDVAVHRLVPDREGEVDGERPHQHVDHERQRGKPVEREVPGQQEVHRGQQAERDEVRLSRRRHPG